MKNLIISVESAVILSGMWFWQYRDLVDKVLVIMVSAFIFFVVIDQLDDRYREHKRKQKQARKFKREIEKLTNEHKKCRP